MLFLLRNRLFLYRRIILGTVFKQRKGITFSFTAKGAGSFLVYTFVSFRILFCYLLLNSLLPLLAPARNRLPIGGARLRASNSGRIRSTVSEVGKRSFPGVGEGERSSSSLLSGTKRGLLRDFEGPGAGPGSPGESSPRDSAGFRGRSSTESTRSGQLVPDHSYEG